MWLDYSFNGCSMFRSRYQFAYTILLFYKCLVCALLGYFITIIYQESESYKINYILYHIIFAWADNELSNDLISYIFLPNTMPNK